MTHQVIQPAGWLKPRGYSNGVAATGRQIYVSGQIGWDLAGQLVSDRFTDQVRQALRNILAVLDSAGARAEHLVRLTWFVTSRAEYLAEVREVGAAYREVIGRYYPAMSVVEVTALVESGAKVEIEATAVVPPQ